MFMLQLLQAAIQPKAAPSRTAEPRDKAQVDAASGRTAIHPFSAPTKALCESVKERSGAHWAWPSVVETSCSINKPWNHWGNYAAHPLVRISVRRVGVMLLMEERLHRPEPPKSQEFRV